MRFARILPLLWLWAWTCLGPATAYPNTQQQQQHQKQQQPLVTYSTTSTTSSRQSNGQASGPLLQPAFVYDAAMPQQDEKVVTSSTSYSQPETEASPSKKVIGSSVASSVGAVVLDGNEPQFTDALGHKVPKPQPSLQVASPIDLLNPDRYEFYTFDEHGELVKRLMTMQEIQSIVANGDGEGPSIIHTAPPLSEPNPEKNVQDIVDSVQSVLNKEVASSSAKNSSGELLLPLLDTPDVSSSWSLILPAIFGNTGGDLFLQQKPQQIVMTPESELVEASTQAAPSPSRATKKPKPAKRKPGNKRKPPSTSTSTTEVTPQVVQEELDPMESVYTGMQQYQHVAANMQDFDLLHMQPIYQKLPSTTAKPETTTRRVFYNNQEIIHSPTSSSSAPSTTEKTVLNHTLAKKPPNVHRKPSQPPHRVKKPTNGAAAKIGSATTSQPSGGKQKVKKKTTTTTTTPPPVPSTEAATSQPETEVSAATTTVRTPAATTPKKKKRKPTRTPGTGTGAASSSKPSKPKRKPTTKPKPGQIQAGETSAPQQVVTQKPTRPQRPKKKPKPTPTPTPTPITTTTTTKPTTAVPQTTVTSAAEAEPGPTQPPVVISTSTMANTPEPEPQTEPSTTTTTTTTAATTKTTTTTTTTRPPVVNNQKPHGKPVSSTKRPPNLHHNRIHSKPVHTTLATVTEATKSESYGLVNIIATQATTTTTHHPPVYPVPSYNTDAAQNLSTLFAHGDHSPLKKTPLPSLAQLQQQLHQSSPSPAPQLSPDQMLSMDQIVLSLTQDLSAADKSDGDDLDGADSVPALVPVKYESAETQEQMQTLANKKKVTVTSSTTTSTTSTTTTTPRTTTTVGTTKKPLIAHYGGSTLATMLSEEESSEVKQSTESATGDMTITKLSSLEDEPEEETPVVLITARPLYFTVTPQPVPLRPFGQTEKATEEEEPETTELPGETQFLVTTPMASLDEIEATTDKPVVEFESESDHVVKLEPLYADVPEAIVTELSEPSSTNGYNQQTDGAGEEQEVPTTEQALRLPVSESSTAADIDADSTEVTPMIADLVQQLNLEMLKPTDQISMANFQTQAATVASTLVDGSNTLVSDVFMNSNETKDELDFLMSDVIQQITQGDQYKPPAKVQPEDDSHRQTNYAQLNTSFLLQPKPKPQRPGEPQRPEEPQKLEKPQSPGVLNKVESETSTEKQQQESTTLKQEATYPSDAFPASPVHVETSTLRIPILSLSQIYAQQQQDEDDEQQLFTNERLDLQSPQAKPTQVPAKQEAIPIPITISNPIVEEPAGDTTETTEAAYTTGAADAITERLQSDALSQETTASEESTTNTNTNIVESYTERSESEEQMPEMLTNGYNEQILMETSSSSSSSTGPSGEGMESIFTTEKTATEEPTTDATTTSSSSSSVTEAALSEEQTTATNVYLDTEDAEEQTSTSEQQLQTEEEEQTEELAASAEDSATNAAQLLPQYSAQPVDDQDQSEQQQEQKVVVVTEIPGDTSVVSSESDMSLSSEQVTEKIELSTVKSQQLDDESMEEISDELTATISEEQDQEQEAEGSPESATETDALTSAQKLQLDDEDPYVKLGETTASVVRPLSQQDKSSIEAGPEEDSYKVTLPLASYGNHPGDQPDEEDEDDQAGYQSSTKASTTTNAPTTISTTKRLNTLKPVSYYVQPSLLTGYNQLDNQPPKGLPYNANNGGQQLQSSQSQSQLQQRPMQRPASLTNLMASSTQATRPPVKLEPSPESSQGLEASTAHMDEDMHSFARLCNELAFSYWKAITSEKISSARSLVISPFALTSMLSMVFLGARGSTSGEMNEILKLDDMVTFNPHLVFKNITSSVEQAIDSDIATAAFVREIFSDRANGKILPFFKEKTQQLYAGHVEEVNFHVVNDIVRRRTNLLVKRHTMGKVLEYLRTNSVWVNGPLATISANLFQTDCSHGSTSERDGEMFFQVHPTVRQRRLVPIPAVLYRSGFTAGYEPKLDATIVAFGRIQDTVSTIYVMPGHQSSISPMDNLDRLERNLVDMAFGEAQAWSRLLTSLMDRPGMEVQLPRFSHRSFVNASLGLQKMGLKGLFKSDFADLRGLTGAGNKDIFLSDMIQINTFSTCGEEKISEHHHVEMYPAPPLRKRNKDVESGDDDAYDSSEAVVDFGSLVQESSLGRGFYDDLLDPKYLELPLPLRPRQARVPDAPRLRFDKPFLYFVRHNPTGMILFMGRFNPRLLP